MSFAPWPASFLESVASCDYPGGRVLDLGCGGETAWRPRFRATVTYVALDRHGPGVGTAANLVGDAERPPLRAESFDLVVAANLFRHIVGVRPDADPVPDWRRLLRPGGSLFLFEDEPGAGTEAECNYAELQALLARLMPAARGPLLPRARFLAGRTNSWTGGTRRNLERPDTASVIGWLRAGSPQPGGEVARLIDRIDRDGLSYGNYWWAAWTRPRDEEQG